MAFMLVGLFAFARPASNPEPSAQITDQTQIGRIGEGYFNFEIASTLESRIRGLSGRPSLPETDALLFVFDEPSVNHCIVMRDMNFNIDILWFDENRTLVHEVKNAPPDTPPEEVYCPDKPAQYVVEIAAGVADKNRIKLGDTFEAQL